MALACPECGKLCGAPQGLGAHRWRAHGVAGAGKARAAVNHRRRPEVPLLPPAVPVARSSSHSLRRLVLMSHSADGGSGWAGLCRCGELLLADGSREGAQAAWRHHAQVLASH